MAAGLPCLCRAGGDVVSRDIGSLRPGAAPVSPLPPEPRSPVFEFGMEDDDPQVAQLAPGLFLHAWADVRACPDCGDSYISKTHLDAHRVRDHSSPEPVT